MAYSIFKSEAASPEDDWDKFRTLNLMDYGPIATKLRDSVSRMIRGMLMVYSKRPPATSEEALNYIDEMRAIEATKEPQRLVGGRNLIIEFTSNYTRPANHLLLILLYEYDEPVWIGRMEPVEDALRVDPALKDEPPGAFRATPWEPVRLRVSSYGYKRDSDWQYYTTYGQAYFELVTDKGRHMRIVLLVQPEEGSLYYSS